MSHLPIDLLRNGARELGVELTDAQVEQLDIFASLLVETNRSLNLTRITEPEEIVINHYLDSFTCLAAANINPGARAIDIGTGAGFPGIPIKIVRPDLAITLMDASLKKLRFIENVIEKLGLENTTLLHTRAEEAALNPAHREVYDIAFTRALADMKVLAELALPLVKLGGVLIAQKSEGAAEEIDAAKPIIGQLGGVIDNIARVTIPHTDITRLLIVISKGKSTPPEFPRPYSRIVKTVSSKS